MIVFDQVTILSRSEESKVPSGCAQMTISASTKVFIALEVMIFLSLFV